MSRASAWRTAVVTGGGSGLGAAFVRALRARGVRVLWCDIDPSRVGTCEQSEECSAQVLDVSDANAVATFAQHAWEALDGVDLWINNAGIAAAGSIDAQSVAQWQRLIDIDLMGVVWGSHAIVPKMRARRRGCVVNVASAAALALIPDMTAYNTAKSGVLGLSKSLAGDLWGSGVSVTVACPTFFQTDLLTHATGDAVGLKLAAGLMQSARLNADDVATRILQDAERGVLVSVPIPQFTLSLIRVLRVIAPTRVHALLAWERRRRRGSA